MPLTSKGSKIKHAMQKHYGAKEGERVFYASKNKGRITGVDMAKDDDNQHMGFTSEQATKVKDLVAGCDSLSSRIDFFENKRSMRKPKKSKPRTKDNMQPSMPRVRQPGTA